MRTVSEATLVCKRGALGCSVYTDAIPSRLDDGLTVTGVRVEVLNVLGAGTRLCPPAARLPERRGLGAGVPLRQRLRRAGGLAPRLRPGDAEQNRAG